MNPLKDNKKEKIIKRILRYILDLNTEKTKEEINNLKDNNIKRGVLIELLRDVTVKIGELFEKKEIFLTELVMTGEILKEVFESLNLEENHPDEMQKSQLEGEKIKEQDAPQIIIGTVQGDMHDIGKNILISLLEANGFIVKDLGVDVSPQEFVEAIQQYKPKILGLSGLLTAAYDSMKRTIDKIKSETYPENGTKNDKSGQDKLSIIIGGGNIDENVQKYVGADNYGEDAIQGVKIIQNILENHK